MMKKVGFENTVITGGFWKKKQDLVRKVTVNAVYDRFKDTGRIDAFKCDWKEGMPLKPHYFWDSDVAKWIEGVAYITRLKKAPALEKKVDAIVDQIEKNQFEDGYFNIYFTVVEPENRFKVRDCHELYCAGHLMEAAVAYYEATGKDKMLKCMCRYADYIYDRFYVKKDAGFLTPGHEELELALIKMYHCTGNEKYLELSKYFIDTRGQNVEINRGFSEQSYYQSHKPVREQWTAEGHAVRACYLYSGMADVARETNDAELREACEKLFDDIVLKKMYITGGIGSSSSGEAFTVPYDLTNLLAYTETCAAISLAYFASRMLQMKADSKYADVIEKVIYNGFLSGLSLDGKAFFYENPLEVIPYLHTRDTCAKQSVYWPPMERSEVFTCSCCPPNVVRFIPSIADYLYTDDGETLYVHQYMQSKTVVEREGKTITVEQTTRYPENGKIQIKVTGGDTKIAFRVPDWYDGNEYETTDGYCYQELKDGETLDINFAMKVKLMQADTRLYFDCSRVAVMRGPVVYCIEAKDNGDHIRDIRINSKAAFRYGKHEELGVPCLKVQGFRRPERPEGTPLYFAGKEELQKTEVTLIPYYAFANRGESEMSVWNFFK